MRVVLGAGEAGFQVVAVDEHGEHVVAVGQNVRGSTLVDDAGPRLRRVTDRPRQGGLHLPELGVL